MSAFQPDRGLHRSPQAVAGGHWTGWATVVAYGLFWLVCALGGGSSRATAAGLLVLRPVTIVCLGVFLVLGEPSRWRAVRTPLLLLSALGAVMACQLVPLPPGLWLALPGRERFLPGLILANAQGAWHPLSVAPDRTWDSLVGLLVPATALLGYAALGDRMRAAVLPAMLVMVGASACLGVAQFVGGDAAPYLYDNTDHGFPVGFFANKNHESVLLVCLFPLLRVWSLSGAKAARQDADGKLPDRWRRPVAAAAGTALIPMILATGSRAGLLLLPLGLVTAWLVRPVVPRNMSRPRSWLASGAIVLLAVTALFLVLASGRALAVQRLFDRGNVLEDGRFEFAGTVVAVLRAGFPAGWGFGTFDPIFRVFEPDWLLNRTYVNNAHNDLLELLLTGGLPAALVLVAFLWWAGRCAIGAFRPVADGRREPGRQALARASVSAIGIALLASLLDYPLRTPLFGAMFAQWCVWSARRPAFS